MKPADPLFALVETFFCDHLQKVRGASPHTIAAYRDAVMLFLQFLADRRGVPVGRLRLVDLQADVVAAFLQHLEDRRGNCIATRNCRRIALRAFFQHALRHDPIHASQYARVLALPAKRCAPTTPRYLEPHQMRHLLEQRETEHADAVFRSARHHALTRHGAQYILTKYAARASAQDATFPKHISPHVLRHSCACALLQAGVDLTVIRDYLGHASITSTTRYAKTNLKMKREALAHFWAQAGISAPRSAPWRPTKSLLTFLSSL